MRCYSALGRPTEAVSAYRRLRQTLSVVLGVAPSAESQRLHHEILATLPAVAVAAAPHDVVANKPASRASRRRRVASRPGSRT
jgi:DNA-binding SARP family transcriptional activator